MVSEGARSKATCLLKSEPLGPPTRILMDRLGVRLTAIDSERPFLGSVAGISDRSLFLLAPRTCERARQVPHLPSDTSCRTRASALKTTRAARQLRRRTNLRKWNERPGQLVIVRFFCCCGARQAVDGTFQVDSFRARRCTRRGKFSGPPLLEASLHVNWNTAHNQSSAFVVTPVSRPQRA